MTTVNKNFKVKNGLQIDPLTTAGFLTNDATGVVSSVPAITDVQTYVKNNTGSTLYKGQPVYISGATGANALISLSSSSSEATSSKTLGLLSQDLTTGSSGYVLTNGTLVGVDTSAWTEGTALWLGSTAGTLSSTKAVAPNHLVYIGVVTRSHATVGEVLVKVQNGFELDELHSVLLDATASIADNEVLAFDSASGLWKNQTSIEAGLIDTSSTAQTKTGAFTSSGTITGLDLVSTASSGNEGGEIRLATAATGSTLTAGTVTIDVYQNKLRIFETGGTNRGAYIDLSAATTGVGSNLLTGGGGGSGTVTSITAGTTGLTGGTITTSGTIDIDTSKVPLLSASNSFTGTQTFIPGSAIKTIIAKAHSSGTARIQEWQDSSGTAWSYIDSTGAFGSARAITGLSLNAISVQATGSIISGNVNNSATTANMLYLTNINTNGITLIDTNSNFYGNTTPSTTFGNVVIATIPAQTPTISSGSVTFTTSAAHKLSVGHYVKISGLTPSGYNGNFLITAVPSTTSFTITNATTGAATGTGSVQTGAGLNISPFTSSLTGSIFKAASGQVANLTEWQDSSGTALASISSAGAIISGSTITGTGITASSTTGIQTTQTTGNLFTSTATTINVGATATTQYLNLYSGLNANLVGTSYVSLMGGSNGQTYYTTFSTSVNTIVADASVSTSVQLYNANASTLSIGSAATSITIGSSTTAVTAGNVTATTVDAQNILNPFLLMGA